jgi:hypothetical protein
MESFSHLFPWQILSRMAGVNLTHRLYKDRTFDVAKLQAEVTRVIANFNPAGHSSSDAYHDGGWSTIGLVTHKGRAGSVCLNSFSGLVGGGSAGFRPPRSAAAL